MGIEQVTELLSSDGDGESQTDKARKTVKLLANILPINATTEHAEFMQMWILD